MPCRRSDLGRRCAVVTLTAALSACASGAQWTNPDDDGGSGASDYDSGTTGYDTGTSSYYDSWYQGGQDSGQSPDTGFGSSSGDDSEAPLESGVSPDSESPLEAGGGGVDSTAPRDAPSGPPPTGLSVEYQVADPTAMSAYIGATLSILNSATTSATLSGLSLRYYYTDEVHMTLQMTINWSHISTTGANADVSVSSSFGTVVPAATNADSYVEFTFSSGSHPALGMGESAVFAWQMQGPDPAHDMYTQTNDYSFDATKTSLASWDHVVLLQGGTVLWGTVP